MHSVALDVNDTKISLWATAPRSCVQSRRPMHRSAGLDATRWGRSSLFLQGRRIEGRRERSELDRYLILLGLVCLDEESFRRGLGASHRVDVDGRRVVGAGRTLRGATHRALRQYVGGLLWRLHLCGR